MVISFPNRKSAEIAAQQGTDFNGKKLQLSWFSGETKVEASPQVKVEQRVTRSLSQSLMEKELEDELLVCLKLILFLLIFLILYRLRFEFSVFCFWHVRYIFMITAVFLLTCVLISIYLFHQEDIDDEEEDVLLAGVEDDDEESETLDRSWKR